MSKRVAGLTVIILMTVFAIISTTVSYGWTVQDEDVAGGLGTITRDYYSINFTTDKLGYYQVTINTYERPYQEVLPIISSNYFKTSESKLNTLVNNIPPNARYNATPVTKVDIVYNNSYYSNNSLLQSALEEMVAELNGRSDLDVQFSTVYSYEEYLVPYQYIQSVGNNDMGYSGDKTYVSGSSDRTTINFPAMARDGLNAGEVRVTWFVRILTGGGSIEYIEPNTDRGYAGYTCTITGSQSGRIYEYDTNFNGGRSICDFTIVDNNTLRLNSTGETFPMQSITVSVDSKIVGDTDPGAWGWGVSLTLGKWTTGYRTSYRPTYFIEGLKQMSWREDAIKFAIYGNHDELRAYIGNRDQLDENEYFIRELNYLQSNQVYYIGAGSSSNQDDFKNVIDILDTVVVGDNNSAMYCDTTTNAANAVRNIIKPFIESKLPRYDESVDWILVNTEINWDTTYSDYENDPPLNIGEHESDYEFLTSNGIQMPTTEYNDEKILAERWRYRHKYTYFDNEMNLVSYHNVWIEDPVTLFDNVGLYRINYKRRDNPIYPNMDLNDAFNAYRYWSTDYDYAVTS